MKNSFSLYKPETAMLLPIIFDSPHSGRTYPEDFEHRCDDQQMTQAEDNYIDDLFAAVPAYGGTLLAAEFPRTYIDVNRAADDIDPELLAHEPPAAIAPTARSRAGIGLIRRILQPGIPVYERPLHWHEIEHRIKTCYEPYHQKLKSLIETAHYNFGQVWHINCHSMPSRTAKSRIVPSLNRLPDFVLGDRDGTSCCLDFRNALKKFIQDMGYSVTINDPYKGVEILKRYGQPARHFHSLQLEVNKRLYWNEEHGHPTRRYGDVKKDIEELIDFVARYAATRLNQGLAAD